MKKYFGTDGIRGEANKELTVDVALRLGYALGYYLNKNKTHNRKPKLILGSDTRISGYMLRSALSAGLNSMGVDIDFVGVLSTPGVAYITKAKKADAGLMISASHNPAKDNGLKIFTSTGYKLADEVEEEIEELMDNYLELIKEPLAGDKVGKFKYAEDDYYLYRNYLVSTVKGNFKGIKIIIDAANGAAYRVSKAVFMELGAELVVINDTPNGLNINDKCGSTYPEILSKVVVGYEADLGLAYDGDADRLIAIDRNGNIVDGDKIIALLAVIMKNRGELQNNEVVTTVMSNMGLENYLLSKEIKLTRANVGDRYVLEKMIENNVKIGGEQSGHIILSDYSTTGDGILSSLKLVEAIRDLGRDIADLVSDIEDWPQELINVRVNNDKKNLWNKNETVVSFIKEKEIEMSSLGRVLVRTSGTEPLIRVMVEGKDSSMVSRIVNEIAKIVEKELS